MRARRLSAAMVTVALLATPGLLGPAEASPQTSRADAPTYQGLDFKYYPEAPIVVPGYNTDHMFFGWDFDDACFHRDKFYEGFKALEDLVRMIRKSGRRVVWAVPPNKSAAFTEHLDLSTLPHGRCDFVGLMHQRELLDVYRAPGFVPLRKRLTAAGLKTFWRTDPHWNTIGGAIYAKALARELSPRLGRLQKYRNVNQELYGYLNWLKGDPATEIGPGKVPRRSVKVRSRTLQYMSGYEGHVKWTTKPARQAWPGKTLLLGDSFTAFAMPVLQPIFQRGEFLWLQLTPDQAIARGIATADTVVITKFQLFLSSFKDYVDRLRPLIRQQLRTHPRR